MITGSRVLLIFLIVCAGRFLAGNAYGQSTEVPGSVNPGGFNCSPAPCVLPPTQASEGGATVTDTPIVSNPLNMKQLLLGSVDFNCSGQSSLGFHLSTDGGSTWQRVLCMPTITIKGRIWNPDDEPSVGYDRKGTAYVAGLYFCTGYCYRYAAGLVAVQKSTDGTHWGTPIVALRDPGQTFPFETSLAVDTSPGSPRVNSVYVSGVMELNSARQVQVSHSTDGGVTWKQSAVDTVQKNPEQDNFTRLAVGKDGTAYVSWQHCRGSSGYGAACPTVYIMFSKSTDGGNTWSAPQQIATVNMPRYWLLPNASERVYNYPAIGADTSDGPYSGNLYVAMYTWTGTFLQVQVIRSTDSGNTWSQPVPVAPPTATHDQFFPALSVSPAGLVGVSWLDRRNDPGDIDYQAFAAISTDGGQSFQPKWQLTTAFSNPKTNGTGNNWMGDYTGSTWAGQDFIAAWMDSSNGIDMQEVVGGIRVH
jgi:hypothetical protein